MKNLVKLVFCLVLTVLGLSMKANAQTYSPQLNGLGSSALFLALGQAASQPFTFNDPLGNPISPTCLWTEGNNIVSSSDNSTGTALTDAGPAWVAWTPSSTGSCSSYSGSDVVYIYAYLQTDSVVGDRCLFNAYNNPTAPKCTISTYPVATGVPATTPTQNKIYPSTGTCGDTTTNPGECPLPAAVASNLNTLAVNYAGTDIRPEDAEFATVRATTACNTAVASGSSFLGLGYSNGSNIQSQFSSSVFHVINFALPTTTSGSTVSNNYTVTPLGAAPIIFAVNGSSWPIGTPASLNVSLSTLAKFLDGTYYTTGQLGGGSPSGSNVNTVIREPLSGTYNTVEYQVPNTSTSTTSQDVGQSQLASQINCPGNSSFLAGSTSNPMHIVASTSGGERDRAIGTGQELSEIISQVTPTNGVNALGYGFWGVSNFAGFTTGTGGAAPNSRYLEVGGFDPLNKSTVAFTGAIPTTNTQLANVDLHNVFNGDYPVWSFLRLVNGGTSTTTQTAQNVSALAFAGQSFSVSTAPNFAALGSMTVLRSHYTPPAGSNYPTTNTNGDSLVGSGSAHCTALPEAGGDVGGVILTLAADSTWCQTNSNPHGQTGLRN